MSKKIKINFVASGYEQLSIGLLSAMVKEAGYKVGLSYSAALFDDKYTFDSLLLGKFFDETRSALFQIEKTKPDVLAFSSVTGTYRWHLEIARKVKKIYPEIKTIFGGPHVSAIPERAINKPEVDFVVVGEGEVAFLEILKHIEEKRTEDPISNTLYINSRGELIRGSQLPFFQELDKLPFPDKTIWEEHIKVNESYMIMASRGCPYRCTFCFNNFFANLPGKKAGKYVRFRSVNHVMKELLWAKKRYNQKLRFIDFVDDNLTLNKQWLGEFLTRYKKEISLPFQCSTQAHYIDEEIVRGLRDAGCQWVEIGVQTADEEYKKLHLKRHDNLKNIAEAFKLIKKYGINLKADHILALPGEPLSAQEKALRFYAQNTPTIIMTFWINYYPGTDMLVEALRKNFITQEETQKLYEGFDFHHHLSDKKIKDSATKKLYKRYGFLFKILPLLPLKLRLKINIRDIGWLPSFLLTPLSLLADVMTFIFRKNPRFIMARKHYVFHLKRFFYEKLTGKKLKAINL